MAGMRVTNALADCCAARGLAVKALAEETGLPAKALRASLVDRKRPLRADELLCLCALLREDPWRFCRAGGQCPEGTPPRPPGFAADASERLNDVGDALHALENAQCDLDDLLYHLRRGGMGELARLLEKAALPLQGRAEELDGEKHALLARAAWEAGRERAEREREYRSMV